MPVRGFPGGPPGCALSWGFGGAVLGWVRVVLGVWGVGWWLAGAGLGRWVVGVWFVGVVGGWVFSRVAVGVACC